MRKAARRRRNSHHADSVTVLVQQHVGALVQALSGVIRDQVAAEAAAYFGRVNSPANGDGRARRRRRASPCIAPGCKNPSKGPRFHYLCESHRDAPKRDYAAWRAARREKVPTLA